VVLVFFPSESIPFRNRDWILITDFDNQTGNPNFDGTIGEALAIDLQQSQHVNVYGGRRLVEALTRMEIRDTDVIGPQLGGEICLREGIAAMLTGNVSKLGESYIINARIVIPSTGDAVMTERATARDDGEVLAAVPWHRRRRRRSRRYAISRRATSIWTGGTMTWRCRFTKRRSMSIRHLRSRTRIWRLFAATRDLLKPRWH